LMWTFLIEILVMAQGYTRYEDDSIAQ